MAPLLPFKQAAERGIVGRGYMRKIWPTLAGLLDLDILDCLLLALLVALLALALHGRLVLEMIRIQNEMNQMAH
jgi:hypothetical protein